jgi:hypothetical protein
MNATDMQANSLKALSLAILERNRMRNRNATIEEKERNFHIEKSTQKLRELRPSCDHVTPQPEPAKLICYWCHSTDFWLSIYDRNICRRCHPPAPGAERLTP